MPVIYKKSQKTGHLKCDAEDCAARSASYQPSSPAAPELTICEAAHKAEKWAYDIGFQAMMFGHTVYCPACAGVTKENKS